MRESIKTYTVLALFALPVSAWAGRPMFTDDATLTTPHTCQIENWFQQSKTVNQTNFLPACNPTGNFEVTAGLTTIDDQNAGKQQSYLLQGKTLLTPLDSDHRYGVGFAFGIDRLDGNNGDNFVYIPLSISSASQNWTTSLNLGWRQVLAQNNNILTWGMGSTYNANEYLSVFSEILGDNKVKPTIHSGLSIDVIQNELQLDMTYGQDLSLKKNSGFFTIGLNYYMPK